jgi:hypothetical protein
MAYQGITLGVEFALPPLGGMYLDGRFHTRPVLTLVGAVLGFAVGMVHIWRLARETSK